MTVLIDGQETSADWISERAYQFGDGLFETLAIRNGSPCLWGAHMRRLQNGCERLSLPVPDFAQLRADVDRVARPINVGVIKIYWTAGRSPRGYARPDPIKPGCVIQATEGSIAPSMANLRVCNTRLGRSPALVGIKHLNRLEQVLARAEWHDSDIFEGLMLDRTDNVIEGTMSNLLLQREGRLSTPDLSEAGIAGVVRGLALELAAKQGDRIEQCPLSLTDCYEADALYLTNSLIGVVPVARLEQQYFNTDSAEPELLGVIRQACFNS